MARYNAMEEQFEEITVFGKPALFASIRIDRGSVPTGLYLYEVRSDDDGTVRYAIQFLILAGVL